MNHNYNNSLAKYYNQINIISNFRKLWEQHIMWTRSFIISTSAELGDLELVTQRLLRNPTDFANALRAFYGHEKAKQFDTLLTDHLLIAASLVNNAKAGNTDAIVEDRKRWFKNADDIASFLSEINPYWSKRQFQSLLYDHLRMVEDEAVYRLNGKFASDIAIYEPMELQALQMADLMSLGIINQFYSEN